MTLDLLAQAPPPGAVTTGEAITFWILGPLALLGALGTVLARNAVHSALALVGTMFCIAVFYIVQQAEFLGFGQIIVYTGAIMMLFLFVLMLAGRDSSDSVIEVLRGHRLAALLSGLGFAVLLVALVGRSLIAVTPVGLGAGGGIAELGGLLFTDYLFAFELTAALLITATLGAMVLGHAPSGSHARRGQRATVTARLRGEHDRISPLPGPGVYATANSVAVPAVLPDGSIAPESISAIIDATPVRPVVDEAEPDAHALTGERSAPADEPQGTDDDAAKDHR